MATKTATKKSSTSIEKLLKAYELMTTARAMSDIYEANAKLTSKYVHATSRGHEAIQIAAGLQLKASDYLSAYYRDDSILLSMGVSPYELMLQLFAKKDDPFSGGRTYYSHPSLNQEGRTKIPHQSSATGMQAIPATGVAMGIQYMESKGLLNKEDQAIMLCSIGDAAMTEGEVAEAFHMAALKQFPIVYLVQDNEWDISANAEEIHFGDATTFAQAFPGIKVFSAVGHDMMATLECMEAAVEYTRTKRKPAMVHAKVPLLGHHTSGVRREWYRDDLEEAAQRDPLPFLEKQLINLGISEGQLQSIFTESVKEVEAAYEKAKNAEEPDPSSIFDHFYAPTPITDEKGTRTPANGEMTLMVDCALFAVQEILEKHPEALLYGQDVGGRLGGVFREAATLAKKFGDDRVFNTPIQEAFIIGSTAGMSAVGAKPIVEVQFADYIWPGLNQLFTELSRSCYLSNGQWPVSSLIRVPIGAYGSGGPYHSSSIESVLSNIRGVKVCYPSTGADMKGLMKAAFYDPNPVVMLEHKGLYWSKIPGTEGAKSILPDEDYILPLGKANTRLSAEADQDTKIAVITYGMGVYWALSAAKSFPGQIEVVDLRTIVPLDEAHVFEAVKKCNRALVLTEEPASGTFARALSGRIAEMCFEHLDAPVRTLGAAETPAIPLNEALEAAALPNADKVRTALQDLLDY
ncbi:MAG: thiamine pyrophosphate-dependent enzyme [Flavobacteriales bacterium]|nr:thiamine pyrophosphate-dependent enzyme [Flavobacteriales bacterium]MDG1765767.1 thiamine pyrophosphate-dependent enzyme [Flavobacteriales bacterium]